MLSDGDVDDRVVKCVETAEVRRAYYAESAIYSSGLGSKPDAVEYTNGRPSIHHLFVFILESPLYLTNVMKALYTTCYALAKPHRIQIISILPAISDGAELLVELFRLCRDADDHASADRRPVTYMEVNMIKWWRDMTGVSQAGDPRKKKKRHDPGSRASVFGCFFFSVRLPG